jgi:hypothetical protein
MVYVATVNRLETALDMRKATFEHKEEGKVDALG